MPAKRTLQDAELCFTQINDLKQMLSGVLNIICRTMEELLKKREVDFVLCFKPNFKDEEIESHYSCPGFCL